MEISETKKSKKYATLVTYLVAIVCLLLGLFLPMFDGNGILALYLPDVFNKISGNEIISTADKLSLSFNADIFGLGVSADIMAYVILLYAVVTVLGLLALVPIGLTFNKESKVPAVLEYTVLCAASIVLSLYAAMALQLIPETAVSLNMIIALGGSLLALAVLCCINKKGTGAVKLLLGIFSAAAFLLLFDLTVIIPALAEPLDGLGNSIGIFPAVFRANDTNVTGIHYLTLLFAGIDGSTLTSVLDGTESVAEKITCCVAAASALIVLINFFIDIISLASNGKKAGLLFNIIRYGLAFLILVLLIIMTAVSRFNFGLFTIILAVIIVLQLLISIFRFIRHLKKVTEIKSEEDFESQKIKFIKPVKQPKQTESNVQDIPVVPEFVGAEPIVAQTIDSPAEQPHDEQMAFIDPAPEVKEQSEYVEPVHETPGEVQMIMDGIPEPEEVKTEDTDTAEVSEAQPEQTEEPEVLEKPVYIAEEEQPEPDTEPVTVQPEEVQEIEPEQPVEEPETAEEPVEEDAGETEVSQPVPPEPVEEQPVYTQTVTEHTEQVRSVQNEEPSPSPAPADSVPVRIEIQQPASAQTRPYIDKRIYSEMYEHTDNFMTKLSETERIEFTRTFIEKANGDVGNIPEYVIGGNNKKFFSAVFIYLGRIRGMISDGLLNKMFKELNML